MIVEDQNMSDCFATPRTVTDRDRTAKIFFGPPVVAFGGLSVRIFIILSQAFER